MTAIRWVPADAGGFTGYLGSLEAFQPTTVTKWLDRYDDTPAPDAEIEPGRHGIPDRGWLPEREQEWRAWRASLPGRTGRPRKDAKTGDQ